MWNDYVWIVVLGAFLAFFTAYGIGANDVANAFATSVGAKTITVTQAVLIASVLEFGGAVLLGSHVADTISNKIAAREEFEEDPEILMYGMLCVLAATGIWLTLASHLELPVSTTHSVVGGIIGMALAFKGRHAVVWYRYDSTKSDLEAFEGVVPVVTSWITSPLLSGIFAVILFVVIRRLILRREDSEQRAYVFFPALVGLTVMTNIYFIVFKGFRREFDYEGGKRKLKHILGPWAHLIAWSLSVISALLVARYFVPYLRRTIETNRRKRTGDLQPEDDMRQQEQRTNRPSIVQSVRRVWTGTIFDHDVHEIVGRDETVNRIHEKTESFDHDTEEVFKYLQVLTAMCDSFEHGANDVANSIGPFASIYMVYKNESAGEKASVPEWILILGGAGIVIGLATYGYNIMRAIGVKLIKVTASRGFSIEMGAAMVITLGSQYGVPLSTTHCQVGATVGIGLLEGKSGVNLWLLTKMIVGWVSTMIFVGGMAAAFFAQGTYTPSIVNLRTIDRFEAGLIDISNMIGNELGVDEKMENKKFRDSKKDDSRWQLAFVQELVGRLISNKTMDGL